MTNISLMEKLEKMATDSEGRSEMSRLRDVYAQVERALQSGVSRKAILEALHQDGFTMSLEMFDKALYRIRSKNKEDGLPAKTKQPPLLTSPARLPHAPPRQFKHDPKPPADLLD